MIRRVLIAAALTVLLSSLTYAQGGGGRKGGGGQMGGGPMGGGGRVQQADKSEILASELKLSQQQRTAIDAIMDDAQKLANPLLPQIVSDKKEMLELAAEGKATDDLTKQLATLNAQMLAVEVDAFTKALATLDAKQKSKAPKLFDLMAGMFIAPGGWHKSN